MGRLVGHMGIDLDYPSHMSRKILVQMMGRLGIHLLPLTHKSQDVGPNDKAYRESYGHRF